MYSNTKIVTSVAAMMLVEQGRIEVDQPLADVLPGFRDVRVLVAGAESAEDTEPLADPIRMRHVFSHSAGFSYGFIEPGSVIDQVYAAGGLDALGQSTDTLETLCDKLTHLPLAYQPGTGWRYSFASDVLARVVEVVSGQRFDEFLAEHIFAPLGMVDTGFWVPPEKADRFITMYAPTDFFDPMKGGLVKADGPDGQYGKPRPMLSGGGGLVSTVSDYLAFIRMIVNGGTWNGAHILKPATLARMRENQLAEGVVVNFPMWSMPGTVFGLGFALRAEVEADDPPASRDEYFWGGMAGTHSWMAPHAGITGFCLTQRMPGFWHPFSHEFRRLAYDLAG
jgi:CubicO group peptidase (beta-lactamase class C family)